MLPALVDSLSDFFRLADMSGSRGGSTRTGYGFMRQMRSFVRCLEETRAGTSGYEFLHLRQYAEDFSDWKR